MEGGREGGEEGPRGDTWPRVLLTKSESPVAVKRIWWCLWVRLAYLGEMIQVQIYYDRHARAHIHTFAHTVCVRELEVKASLEEMHTFTRTIINPYIHSRTQSRTAIVS